MDQLRNLLSYLFLPDEYYQAVLAENAVKAATVAALQKEGGLIYCIFKTYFTISPYSPFYSWQNAYDLTPLILIAASFLLTFGLLISTLHLVWKRTSLIDNKKETWLTGSKYKKKKPHYVKWSFKFKIQGNMNI